MSCITQVKNMERTQLGYIMDLHLYITLYVYGLFCPSLQSTFIKSFLFNRFYLAKLTINFRVLGFLLILYP